MIAAILIFGVLIFGFVVWFGAPYLPTLKNTGEIALDLLDLKPGQTLIELGSGDGRIMRKAAKRGLHVVGYELNPILVFVSMLVTWKYRRQVRIIWGSFWSAKWPEYDGVYVFLLDKYMDRLDKKIRKSSKSGVKVASNCFEIPGKKHKTEQSGVYLYIY